MIIIHNNIKCNSNVTVSSLKIKSNALHWSLTSSYNKNIALDHELTIARSLSVYPDYYLA